MKGIPYGFHKILKLLLKYFLIFKKYEKPVRNEVEEQLECVTQSCSRLAKLYPLRTRKRIY